MPILWRYQIKQFCLKFFFILLLAIVSTLTLKVNHVAKLLSLGVSTKTLLLFILLQIPALLPLVIAISGLIATYLVIQQLSQTNALSTLRSSGLSLNRLLAPLFFMGLVLTLINLYLVMEIQPIANIQSYNLAHDASKTNPLIILKKRKLPLLKNAFIHMNLDKSHTIATDLFIFIQNPYTNYLNLLKADFLSFNENQTVEIENSSFVTTLSQEESLLPTMLIENVAYQSIPLTFFTDSLKAPYVVKIYNILTMKELANTFFFTDQPLIRNKVVSEFFGRIALAILPFMLVLVASIFSIRSAETKAYVNTSFLVLSVVICIAGIFVTKSARTTPTIAVSASIIPYFLVTLGIFRYKYSLERGKL